MQIHPKARVLRLGRARQLTRAVLVGRFTELNPMLHWEQPPE